MKKRLDGNDWFSRWSVASYAWFHATLTLFRSTPEITQLYSPTVDRDVVRVSAVQNGMACP